MKPTFQLDTKHGAFTVTVLDPTPTARDPHREADILKLESNGPVTINRVEVTVSRYYTRYPERGTDGEPTGKYRVHSAYGLSRVSGYEAVPDGVRRVVDGYALEALNRITPDLLKAARVGALKYDADRKVDRVAELRREAAALEAEAVKLELEAASLASLIAR